MRVRFSVPAGLSPAAATLAAVLDAGGLSVADPDRANHGVAAEPVPAA